jgi:hypothetical protein
MSAALASTQDSLDDRTALTKETGALEAVLPMAGPPPAPPVPADVQLATGAPPPDALARESQPPGAADTPLVHSPEIDSSHSISTRLMPDADAATITGALVSGQDRQHRLTSLLHHLTLDPGTHDQELPIAAALPALWVGETRQMRRVDNASIGRRFAWLFALAGVTGALVGWGTVLQLPLLVRHGLPQDNTEPLAAANVQSSTGAPRLIHDSLPQEKLPVAANVQPATETRLIHDSLPQEKLPVASNVQSNPGAAPLFHYGLPLANAGSQVVANVQSTTEGKPLIHDSLPQEDKPPLRAPEISSLQSQNRQLSQSVGSSQLPDADEIAALLRRGKDFAAHGDLISARLLLRRAAEAGSAEAALALGETFDPPVFQRLGVIGITPDAASARKWYERAAELGSPIASQYLAKSDSAP